MGSPGAFIHFGTLGGRLWALSLAPSASPPARPPAMTAPPTNAPPSHRNRRRDVAAISLSLSVGSVILHPSFPAGDQKGFGIGVRGRAERARPVSLSRPIRESRCRNCR